MHAPERLGKYLIRRELGRGAMGVVYEGFDPFIERAVAIKVLRIEESNPGLDAELRLRFRREAQAAGRLSHPHIVSVYEYGEEADSHSAFIAMELVEGRDLKSLFDDGTRFPLDETGRIMGELLGALQHAHERGVVHRDIKPANIILLADGSVKVADFGIAKLDTSELTQLGSVLGTVSHMSPEQLTGEAVDRRSDLFSCGVILYQLLTGERAFTGSPATVMHRVLHENPAAPSSVVAALPRSLDAVVGKAMAKAPADRYPTADAFAAALRAAIAGASTESTIPAAVPRAAPRAADRTVPSSTDRTIPAAAEKTIAAPTATMRTAPGAGADPDATVLLPRSAAAASPVSAAAPTSRRPAAVAIGALALVAAGAAAYFALKAPSAPTAREDSGTTPVAATVDAGSASASGSASAPALAAAEAASSVASAVAAVPSASTATSASPALATASGPSADEIEQEAWDDALKVNTAAAYEAYLKGYPKGRYAPRARVRLAALAPKPLPAAPAPTIATAPAPAPTPSPPAKNEARPASPPAGPPVVAAAPPPGTKTAGVASAPSPTKPGGPASAPAPAKSSGPTVAQAPAKPGTTPATAPPAATTATAKPGDAGPSECASDTARRTARCQVALGHMYRNGSNGVARDPTEATRWYRRAAEQGNDVGQYELGRAYENGHGVAKDPVEAVSWFRKAADQGLARAQNRLGVAYENGIAGPANLVLAADWYKKAADQGNPDAQTNLARLYLRGRGVFKDVAKAAELAQKAADQGDPNAMVVLAGMYQSGEGKPRDPARATKLYRDALASPGLSGRGREIAQAAVAGKP